jgi:hypothetical protein
VDVLWVGKHYERLCGDLLVVHQRACTLGKMETSSHLASDEITNLLSHPVLRSNRMLIVCVTRNQVSTHTVQKMDTE